MTHRMRICWFMSLHEPFSCNSFHSLAMMMIWHGWNAVIKVECVKNVYEYFKNCSSFELNTLNLMMTSEILENNQKFMKLVFHWVTKTIKSHPEKLFAQGRKILLLFLMFMGLRYELKYVHEDNNSGSRSRRSNNDKILRAAMRLKEIVLMFNWWFYDA